MSRKRPVLEEDTDTSGNGREVKKQKTLPRRGKVEAAMEEFLDLLRPATDKSLSKFNSKEEQQGRVGIVPIDIVQVEGELNELWISTPRTPSSTILTYS